MEQNFDGKIEKEAGSKEHHQDTLATGLDDTSAKDEMAGFYDIYGIRRPEILERLANAKEWYKETMAAKVIRSLEKHNITGVYVKSKEEALEKALGLIPEGSKVGHGGSLTLDQLGALDILRKGDFRLIDRHKPGINAEEMYRLNRESLLADVYIMSTNAITMDGKLVNIDGGGNRVAALSFGPSKVIIIAGINKIVPDEEAALQRIKNYVAPIHAKRRDRPLPCAKTGTCQDCRGPVRSCNIQSTIHNQRIKGRITVIICGEELGL